MKKISILVTAPLDHIKDQKVILNKFFNCIFLNHKLHNQINQKLEKVDGWICSPSPEKMISIQNYPNIKKIKFIASPSTGTSHIDKNLKQIKNFKILSISMSKKVNLIRASSEFTFALGLSLVRKIPYAINLVHKNYWRNAEKLLRSNEIFNSIVGIIGFGRIGKNIYKYSKAFGMNTIVFDPYSKNTIFKKRSNLNRIQNSAKLIFICINLTKKNYNFVNLKFFENLKQKPFLVNTSRGEVIDEKSFLLALRKKMISAAAVDVISNEQNLNLKKNKLIQYSKKNHNLIITPHIAGLTFESESKAMSITIDLIKNYIKKNEF